MGDTTNNDSSQRPWYRRWWFEIRPGTRAYGIMLAIPTLLNLVSIAAGIMLFQAMDKLAEASRQLELSGLEMIRSSSEVTESSLTLSGSASELLTSLGALQPTLDDFNSALEEVPSEVLTELKIKELKRSLDVLAVENAELRKALMDNPERAVSLPLLHQEIEHLESRVDTVSASTAVQLAQIYNFSKWFLGLMISLAIGLVAMGFLRAGRASG